MQAILVTVTKIELKTDIVNPDRLVKPPKQVQVTLLDAKAGTYVSIAVPASDAARYPLGQEMVFLLHQTARDIVRTAGGVVMPSHDTIMAAR